MAALTQMAWYEDRYSAGENRPAPMARHVAERQSEARDATIRFIRSQIGIETLAAAAAERASAPQLVDF